MKKLFCTLLFAGFGFISNATTYYWIGGLSSAVTTSFTNGANWTTDPVVRTPVGGTITIGTTDIFIFDGSNLGPSPGSPVTGPATIASSDLAASPFSGLKVINGANIQFYRLTSGTSNFPINGDGNAATPDLLIDGTSTVTLGGGGNNFNTVVLLGAAATISISGSIYFGPPQPVTSYHTRSFITALTAGSVVFESGSNAYVYDSLSTSPWNGSIAFSIVFKNNASLYYYTGRSPIGSSSSIQFVDFQSGSNLYMMRLNRSYLDNTTVYASSSWTNNKYFGNIFVQNATTFIGDGPVWRSENVTVGAGSVFTLHSSGQTGIVGNIVVDGTLNAPGGSTNNVVFGADGNQTVSGAGLIDVPVITNSAVTNLLLQNSITLESANTSNIYGNFDFGTRVVSGPGAFSSKGIISPTSYTGTTVVGGYQLTGVSAAVSGIAGQYVTGPGVATNTVVLAFSGGGGTINLSKPVTVASVGGTFTFSTLNPATLLTSNAAGIDGSVTTTTKSFSPFTSYIFNTATTSPFSLSSPDSATNVTFNASATTNRSMSILGTLNVNSGKTSIRSLDSLKLRNANPIGGGTFDNTKYIVTQVNNGTGDKGVLMVTGLSSVYTLPVGSTNYYMPITLTPTTPADYFVSAFEGITKNGMPNGTPFTASEKSGVVDAVWIINRSANVTPTTVTLQWPQILEGATFTVLPGASIGVARHDGLTWTPATGSGNNTSNTATGAPFSSFSPFGVGQIAVVLPVRLTSISAKTDQGNVNVSWKVEVENNTNNYEVERSADGNNFIRIATVPATGNNQYFILDHSPLPGTGFYRVKIIDKNSGVAYSNVVRINFNNTRTEINIYPNPVQNNEMKIDLINLEKGLAQLSLYNMEGKVVMRKSVQYDGGVQKVEISLPRSVSKGVYRLFVSSGSLKLEQKVMVD